MQRIFKNHRNQEEETSAEEVDLSRMRREKCGGANLKLSVEISQKLIELNNKSWATCPVRSSPANCVKRAFHAVKTL